MMAPNLTYKHQIGPVGNQTQKSAFAQSGPLICAINSPLEWRISRPLDYANSSSRGACENVPIPLLLLFLLHQFGCGTDTLPFKVK